MWSWEFLTLLVILHQWGIFFGIYHAAYTCFPLQFTIECLQTLVNYVTQPSGENMKFGHKYLRAAFSLDSVKNIMRQHHNLDISVMSRWK